SLPLSSLSTNRSLISTQTTLVIKSKSEKRQIQNTMPRNVDNFSTVYDR
mgnify:CR=1